MSEGQPSGTGTPARGQRYTLEQHLAAQQQQMQQMQSQLNTLAELLSQQQQQSQQQALEAAQAVVATQAAAAAEQAAAAAAAAMQEQASFQQQQQAPEEPEVEDALEGLPRSLRLEKPPIFEGEMDGDTVSAFVHKLDLLFSLSGLQDGRRRAAYAVTCLSKAAYTWYISMTYRLADLTWPTLKQDLLDNFRPMDYTYQSRQALARCRQTGDVRGYVRAFRLRLVRCVDVQGDEAMFRFIEGLKPLEQRHVRLARPADFHQAAAIAEQMGSTLDYSRENGPGNGHRRGRQRYQQQQQHVRMELGALQGQQQQQQQRGTPAPGGQQRTGQRFQGECRYCHIYGHKERDCRKKARDRQSGQLKGMHGGQPGGQQGPPTCGGPGAEVEPCDATPTQQACTSGIQASGLSTTRSVATRARDSDSAGSHTVPVPGPPGEPTLPRQEVGPPSLPIFTSGLQTDSAQATGSDGVVAPTSAPLSGSVSSATTSSRLLVLPIDLADARQSTQTFGALVDSGATTSFVGERLVASAGLELCDAPLMSVTLADGSVVNSRHVCQVQVTIAGSVQQSVGCRVVPDLSSDIVLGMDWLQQWNPHIDWVKYILQFTLGDGTIVTVNAIPRSRAAAVEICSLDTVLKTVRGGNPAWFGLVRSRTHLATMEVDGSSSAGGSAAPLSRWDQLCERFPALFREPGTPPERAVKHRIDLVDGSTPPAQRLYRMSHAELAEVRRQLDIYLEKGWVRPSTSPYGAPILFVRKKDGSLRMCIDYRALNKQTKVDRYPLPRIDDLLDRLCNAKVISSIDLQQGYHQVAIEEGHEFRTAFASRFGLYEFTVMPFGLCNAPSTFQRLMNEVFHEALDQFVLVYLDDILVYSSTVEEHERHLTWVFEKLIENKLYAKRSKCEFGKGAVQYLGHIVGSGDLRVDPSKVSAVGEWESPRDVKQVQQFLGFANYYNRFIKDFARIAAPISNLLASSKEFEWGSDQEAAFVQLKAALTTAPVLALPDFDRDFVVTTDASNVAIGGTLSQLHGGQLRPVCYFSKKLQSAERNYSVSDRELLAIYSACMRWRCYLQGKHTVVYTDHEPLKYLHTQPNVSSRQARWLERLGELSLEIVYLPGGDNVVADVLSRYSHDRDEAATAHVARFDTADVSLHPRLREWLRVVAPGCELHTCLRAARQGLAAGRKLASIVCKFCAQVHLDSGDFATRVHRYHRCLHCSKQWQVTPNVQGNPLAVLEPSLLGGRLYVSRLPDQQPTDPVSQQQQTLPDSTGELSSLVVEPSFLVRVGIAQGDVSDPEMVRLCARGRGTAADFAFRELHGVSLLYRVASDGYRLVIPRSCRQVLLDEAHNSLSAGHFGVAKTLKFLGQRVWWPHMLRSVKRHVSACQICQRHKDSTQAQPGLLQPLPIPAQRFSCWSMDFITDLPLCNGFNGVFTVVDRFSKFCRLIPVHVGEGQLSAAEVAKLFFANVVVLFGVPREVLHDRDPRFTGSFWTELWKLLGTRTVFSSSYHPQTDGQTERTHRTLEQVVRCMLAEQSLEIDQWCSVLPMVELAINNSVQESTGKAPTEVVFGAPVQQPLDIMLGADVSNDSAQSVAARVQKVCQEARQQLERAQQWQKRYYDSRHRDVAFEVGQQVLLSTKNLSLPGSRKFRQRWVGPFRVVARIGATAYRLELGGRFSRLHPVFHVSLLKAHVPGGSSQSPPEPIEVDGELEFEIDRIIGHRTRGRAQQYLVHWRGYDHSEDTWLSERDLGNAIDVLSAYKQSVGLS